MADPRFTEAARKFIQDIQIYSSPYVRDADFELAIILKNNTNISGGVDEFADRLGKLSFPRQYTIDFRAQDIWNEGGKISEHHDRVFKISLAHNGKNRDIVVRLGAKRLISLAEQTGMPVEELLEKVNLRQIEHTISANDLRPAIQKLQAERKK